MLKDNLHLDQLHNSELIVSSAYLAPVSYYASMIASKKTLVECYDNYEKQSYRNRCSILTANGVRALTIPVEKTNKTLMKDVRISTHDDWQIKHWRAIESAYNSSAFFEYYADDLKPFYEKKWDFLFDFNQEIQYTVLQLLDTELTIEHTINYQTHTENSVDLRQQVHPKRVFDFNIKNYYQVFDLKFGFNPNLSIIDLLFNMGPESQLVLR